MPGAYHEDGGGRSRLWRFIPRDHGAAFRQRQGLGGSVAELEIGAPERAAAKKSQPAPPLGTFSRIRKARFYLDHDRSVEVDLHAVHEDDDGTDLMIEVKDWEKEPSLDVVRRFVEVKEALAAKLTRRTVFLF
ncbi:MAG: hypothetical protein GY856_43245 [bacterium]|nr:hypothetical protein [bacterium]